jgi:hypothetical protein
MLNGAKAVLINTCCDINRKKLQMASTLNIHSVGYLLFIKETFSSDPLFVELAGSIPEKGYP